MPRLTLTSSASDASSFPVGEILETRDFSAISLGDERLLVIRTNYEGTFPDNSLIRVTARGSNDWFIREGESFDYHLKRDWNGHLTIEEFDPYDWDFENGSLLDEPDDPYEDFEDW